MAYILNFEAIFDKRVWAKTHLKELLLSFRKIKKLIEIGLTVRKLFRSKRTLVISPKWVC